MARGVNKVILVGNLGKDPEVRYMPSGNAVANVTLATTDSWKDKQTGEKQERTEWHRITAWRHLAERAQRFLRKGKQVYVEGRLETRKWQDQSGQDRYTTEVIANEMQMLGGRADEMGGRPSGGGFRENRPAPQQPQQSQGGQQSQSGQQSQGGQKAASDPFDDNFTDDDIPF